MRALPLVFVVVSALAVSAPSAGAAAPAVDPVQNIRPRDAAAALMLRFGVEHSPRFRDLVQTLEASNVIVYIDVRQDGARPVGGGLYFMGGAGRYRWVRVIVHAGSSNAARNYQNIVQLTAILGHELQHAREAADAPTLRNLGEFERYFRSIAIAHPDLLDTQAARDAGRRIEAELHGHARRDEPPARPRGNPAPVAAVRRQET